MEIEAVNITAAILGKKLGAKKTIARINNLEYLTPDNRSYFASLGIDSLIYPEVLASQEVISLLKQTGSWYVIITAIVAQLIASSVVFIGVVFDRMNANYHPEIQIILNRYVSITVPITAILLPFITFLLSSNIRNGIGLWKRNPEKFKQEIMPIWAILKNTMDDFFDIIKAYGEYGLDKVYFELGQHDVMFFILPGSDTALVAIVPALANRGLLEVELENARRRIIKIIEQ